MSAQPESIQDKIARYTRDNNGGPLTAKQRKRLGQSLPEQHAGLHLTGCDENHHAETVCNPENGGSQIFDKEAFLRLCGSIDKHNHAPSLGTYLFDVPEQTNAALDSMRSKITRVMRFAMMEYSTHKHIIDGRMVLQVIIRS